MFILDDLEKVISTVDMSRRSEEGKDVAIENYIPAIFFLNPETADINRNPILSFSVSFVNEKTKEEDNIIA